MSSTRRPRRHRPSGSVRCPVGSGAGWRSRRRYSVLRLLVLDEPTNWRRSEQRAGLCAVLAEVARTSVIVLSTHQTEDVAALCERVIVLDTGMVRYDGTVHDLVAAASGRVWVGDDPDPRAIASWRIGSGRYRNIADRAPSGAEAVEPTLEDAYLLLRAEAAHPERITT